MKLTLVILLFCLFILSCYAVSSDDNSNPIVVPDFGKANHRNRMAGHPDRKSNRAPRHRRNSGSMNGHPAKLGNDRLQRAGKNKRNPNKN
jgi:hypothetical protein